MKRVFALVDERISDACLSSLEGHGYYVIKLPKMSDINSPIASHTDIISFKLKEKLFFSEKYFNRFFDILSPLNPQNITLTKDSQGVNYPLDAIFNGLLMGELLFCKSDTFSKEILAIASENGVKAVHVKQGYPACVTLKISENAAITADKGMEKALKSKGISVLTIENGAVSLPPYEYGFIGGAGAAFEDKVYFLGDIKKHPDGERIISFTEENGRSAVSLSNEPLVDLGGILFIEQDI